MIPVFPRTDTVAYQKCQEIGPDYVYGCQSKRIVEAGAYGHLQDFHFTGVHPPDVSVKDQVVHPHPVSPVLLYRFGHDDPVQDAVHLRVVRVRFH